MMEIYRQDEQNCPHCDKQLNAAGTRPGIPDTDPRAPQPGDLTVCYGCLAPLAFGPELRLQFATPEEALEALPMINWLRAYKAQQS